MRYLPLIIVVFASACSTDPYDPSTSLVEKAEYYTIARGDKCDGINQPIKRELAKILDAKETELQSIRHQSNSSEKWDLRYRRYVGPTYFYDFSETRPVPENDGWEDMYYSWQGAYEFYLKIRDEPINENWLYLNRWVRSLLVDDIRQVDSYYYEEPPYVAYVPHAGITRQDRRTFVIELNTTDFFSNVAFFEEMVAKYWTNDQYGFRIFWKTGDFSYQFKFLEGPGQRSYVSLWERTINLSEGDDDRVVAHEIGHAIGFPDRYFTSWDEESCGYRVQYNRYDLMSVGTVVVDADWAELDLRYPVKNP